MLSTNNIIRVVAFFHLTFCNLTKSMNNDDDKEQKLPSKDTTINSSSGINNSRNSGYSESMFARNMAEMNIKKPKELPLPSMFGKKMPPTSYSQQTSIFAKGQYDGPPQQIPSMFGSGAKNEQEEVANVGGNNNIPKSSMFRAIQKKEQQQNSIRLTAGSSMFAPFQLNRVDEKKQNLQQRIIDGIEPMKSASMFGEAQFANKSMFAAKGFENQMPKLPMPSKSVFDGSPSPSFSYKKNVEEEEINTQHAEEFAKKGAKIFLTNVNALLRRITTLPKVDQIYGTPILEVLLKNEHGNSSKHEEWTISTYQWFTEKSGKSANMLAFVDPEQQGKNLLRNRLFLVNSDDAFIKLSMADHGDEPSRNIIKMQLSTESSQQEAQLVFTCEGQENFNIEVYKENNKCHARERGTGIAFILYACPLASWLKNGCMDYIAPRRQQIHRAIVRRIRPIGQKLWQRHVFLLNHLKGKLYELEVEKLASKCDYNNEFEHFIQPALVTGWETWNE